MNPFYLKYHGNNLGDEIQTLSYMRHNGHVKEKCFFIDRDNDKTRGFIPYRDKPDNASPNKLYVNGWFSWDTAHKGFFGFDAYDVRGVYIRNESFLTGEFLRWLQVAAPIGCRDTRTVALLKAAGVPCYFSKCMTLTLAKHTGLRSSKVVFVDVPAKTQRRIMEKYHIPKSQVVLATHKALKYTAIVNDVEKRFEKAEELLKLYATSYAVITTRLHVFLPCTALGTPVLVLPPYRKLTFDSKQRYTGYEDLLEESRKDFYNTMKRK